MSYDKEERLYMALDKRKSKMKRETNFTYTKLPSSDIFKHADNIPSDENQLGIEHVIAETAPTIEDSNLPSIMYNEKNMTVTSPPQSEHKKVDIIGENVHPINSPEHTESLGNTDNANRMRPKMYEKNDSILTRADTITNREEIKDDVQLSSLIMPPNLMSNILSNTLSRQSSTKCQYASCGLWDFAGQLEFYATHQAFLTSSAIYILVSSMDDEIEKQDVKPCFAEYKKLGGMLLCAQILILLRYNIKLCDVLILIIVTEYLSIIRRRSLIVIMRIYLNERRKNSKIP